MLSNIRWSAFAVLTALGSLSPLLMAEPANNGAARPPAAKAAPARPPAASAELTPAQRQQVDALRTKAQSQLAPLREQLIAKRKELDALWAADAPSRATILKKASELDAIRQQMRQIGVDQRLSYLALLAPEQRAAWKSRHAGGLGHGDKAHGGMGSMHGGGMGNMHGGSMGNMHGGMGNMQGAMGMGPADDCLGLEECSECMDCEGSGACRSAPAPAAPPPSTPPRPPAPPAR